MPNMQHTPNTRYAIPFRVVKKGKAAIRSLSRGLPKQYKIEPDILSARHAIAHLLPDIQEARARGWNDGDIHQALVDDAGLTMNLNTFRVILADLRDELGYPTRRGRLPENPTPLKKSANG